jgi:excinuclease ABC subunit A
MAKKNSIIVRGAREHNLKDIDIEIPRNKLVVITGLSGSGKSSLAFDTIYAEGQRRYVESLSAYARQFLGLMEKPDVDYIEGLSPAVSIEQRSSSKNPRSTVATVTEIYDYLRLLFARIGVSHCHQCGRVIEKQTSQQMVDQIMSLEDGTKFQVLAPLVRGRKGEYRELFRKIQKDGYVRVRVDGVIKTVDEVKTPSKNKKHDIEVVVDRLVANQKIAKRLADSLETALGLANGIVLIDIIDGDELLFSEHMACLHCGLSFEEPAPRMFSFNSPYGACDTCHGLGTAMEIDPALIVPDPSLSIAGGALATRKGDIEGSWFEHQLAALEKHYKFKRTTPFKKLSQTVQKILLYGNDGEELRFKYGSRGSKWVGEYTGKFEGVIPNLERRHRQTSSAQMRDWIEGFMNSQDCPDCHGARLNPTSLAVRVGDHNIYDIVRMSVKDSVAHFRNVTLSHREEHIAHQILKELQERLEFLNNVGLGYLSLDRSASTLSGGESQRIRLATQIGSQLVGVLYILDEPSIGLHQRDNSRLLNTLRRLRDIGNTVIVVEHDRETIEDADYVIDLGPGAGRHGGEVVVAGTPQKVLKHKTSLTAGYLSGRLQIAVPEKRRNGNGKRLSITGATGHNLHGANLKFPLGAFTCITGVSGSGKSSLITSTLYPALSQKFFRSKTPPLPYDKMTGVQYIDKVIDIDQSPIGRTPRSNPATYTGLFTPVRDLFAQLPESKIRGYKPGRFSFNVKGGRCEACQGGGLITIEMHFLPDVHVTCEVCKGKRYDRETLEVRYKGRSIADVLEMTVSEALTFFSNVPSIQRKLQTLDDVGLGYIHLGQQATTLSGGEAQRVKLATELSKMGTGKTLYILDEPTTGLHFEDIKMLLSVLNRLVDKGNTVVVIEHNMDVIKTADWIIDLGPEGGDEGGRIIAEGTPETVAQTAGSYTGKYLQRELDASAGNGAKKRRSVA